MKINYYKLTESEMNDKPFAAGSLYRTTDTDKLYLDPVGGGGTHFTRSGTIT